MLRLTHYSRFGWILSKEFREMMASRAFWLLLLMIGPLVGHAFITAVDSYAEASGIGGGPAALAQGLSPLDGILVPTFEADAPGAGWPRDDAAREGAHTTCGMVPRVDAGADCAGRVESVRRLAARARATESLVRAPAARDPQLRDRGGGGCDVEERRERRNRYAWIHGRNMGGGFRGGGAWRFA